MALRVCKGLEEGPADEEGDSKTSFQRRWRKRGCGSEKVQVRDLNDSSHLVFVGQDIGELSD